MKKKVLSGMLLTSMLILGAAPVVGFAQTDETVAPTNPAITGHGAGTAGMNLSENTGRGFTANAEGPANAKSTAEFNITEGNLTLDRVPDMHFKRADHGDPTVENFRSGPVELVLEDGNVYDATGKAPLSKNVDAYDGNNQLKLQISDYRGSSVQGWTLRVKLGNFKTQDNKTITANTMTLTPTGETPVTFASNADTVLLANNKNSNETYQYDFAQGSANKLNFSAQSVDPGLYQATMTWTLSNTYTP